MIIMLALKRKRPLDLIGIAHDDLLGWNNLMDRPTPITSNYNTELDPDDDE